VRKEVDGSGLGLYLVKILVESAGGEIFFESSEGKGAHFWFTLPVRGMQKKTGEVSLADNNEFSLTKNPEI
jgi:signal transduction histidine kinase